MKHLLFICLFFSFASLDSLAAKASDAKTTITRSQLDHLCNQARKRYQALDGIAIEAIERECSGLPAMMFPDTHATIKIKNKSYLVIKETNYQIPFKWTTINARLHEPEESHCRLISKVRGEPEKRIAYQETKENAAFDYRRYSNPFEDILETAKDANIELADAKSSSLQRNVWRISLSFKNDLNHGTRIVEIDKETGIIVFNAWHDQSGRPTLTYTVKSIHDIRNSLEIEREMMELKEESQKATKKPIEANRALDANARRDR